MSNFRTDRHNNPTAFTTDIAKQAGLVLGKDYEKGDSFKVGSITYYTAKLLGDPVGITINVIDKIGFYTKSGAIRWEYIAIPRAVWNTLNVVQKILTIKYMYGREGGDKLKDLFI